MSEASARTVRPTPFELIFAAPPFGAERWQAVRDQAAQHGATTMGDLLAQPAAGELLRELAPEGEGEAHREAVAQVGALLFHAFRYWLHGQRVYRVSEATVSALLRDGPVAAWQFRTPAAAGYVQLPRNLFWARHDHDVPPEPADGFFWSAPTVAEGAHGERLDILLCLGVRADRPGLTVVPVSLEPGSDPAAWADVQARAAGVDFENVLPGGELKGYRAITTHAELLKLVVRTFRHIDRHARAIVQQDGVFLVGAGDG